MLPDPSAQWSSNDHTRATGTRPPVPARTARLTASPEEPLQQGLAWGRRVQRGGAAAWGGPQGEPTYPWESTVSFAFSSARDRTERSLRRIWGSLSGCRQLRRTGTRWGSASPRAGPGTEQPGPVPVGGESPAPDRRAAPLRAGRTLPIVDMIISEKSLRTFSPAHSDHSVCKLPTS